MRIENLLAAVAKPTSNALGIPALGDAQHGFPYLSGAGRLVLKDIALLAGSWLVIVDSARGLLGRR